ncbi:hypothetical protein SAMN02745857_03832 [Andreprevotia lacus DSM 23236]|jgi:hypothetical protein|uniref:Uncharacterized protein n=1 Tax=Andreprevotia lacus DSM 23236 TaxID=1121001 RepID=A0A1W1XZX5_9NEIS|nr:hypothetical protein [Andreprevotia lacus]SMC29434.1 hypothetical protein SAMN02745857_03832 [Andreprevotia lacus DSM 23236]
MSSTLWFCLATDTEDDVPDDLVELYDRLDALDARCERLDVPVLSELIDYSDAAANLDQDDPDDDYDDDADPDDDGDDWTDSEAEWRPAADLLPTLRALLDDLGDDPACEALVAELQDITTRASAAEADGVEVRLVYVM